MNIQQIPPQKIPPKPGPNPCPACGQTLVPERMQSLESAPDFDRSALVLLESENSGLRKLLVELIEKNQQLREQLEAAIARNPGTAADLRLVDSRIAS
jgi:hypothetical protein